MLLGELLVVVPAQAVDPVPDEPEFEPLEQLAPLGSAEAGEAVPASAQGNFRGAPGESDMFAKSVLRMPLRRVPERESTTRRVWANLDGSVTEAVYAQPVQVSDGAGAWRPVDLSLVAGGDGVWVPVAGPLGVALTGTSSGGVAVTSPNGRFVMRHEGGVGVGR